METSQIFIENCNNVSEGIRDTVHIPLDSAVSFAAIEKIQDYYDKIFSRMQTDMGNVIMVFSFILGLFTICLGVKFVWDAFVAKKWYSDREKELKKEFRAKVIEIQKEFCDLRDSYVVDSIMSYVKMGQQLYREAGNQPTKEAFLQMYMALNFLLSSEYKKEYLPLYEVVVVGIENTFYTDDTIGKNLALDPLSKLKEILDLFSDDGKKSEKKNVSFFLKQEKKENDCEKINEIKAKIDSILNRMESDSDDDTDNPGDSDDETDDSGNAGELEPSSGGSISPADASEIAEETADGSNALGDSFSQNDGTIPPVSENCAVDTHLEETEIQTEALFPPNEKNEPVGGAANNVDAPDNAKAENSTANQS